MSRTAKTKPNGEITIASNHGAWRAEVARRERMRIDGSRMVKIRRTANPRRDRVHRVARLAMAALAGFPLVGRASLFTGDTLDAVANGIAWVVLVLVPIIGIVVFWLIHVMPEKIAHKRHHPQTAAIQCLCLLSLVFGGLLWPIAWLWAYTRPVAHKLAYGTDRHDDYFVELGERARAGTATPEEIEQLRGELDALHARGALSPSLARLREDVNPPRAGASARTEALELERRGA
jgi:hypothetical protein